MSPADPPVWLDGSLVDPEQAAVSVFDQGLTVGDGVFETAKVTDGIPFAMRRHLRRLRRSATGLGIDVPYDDDALRRAAAEVIGCASFEGGRLRITVTGGRGPLGSSRGGGAPTAIVALSPDVARPAATPVVTVPWPRNDRGAVTGLKTISYAENVVALARAAKADAGEAIFPNLGGDLCEGTGTNVFHVTDGVLGTPPLSSGCLAGITRELLLEITDAVEVDLPIDRLRDADEAFLASSTRQVQAIESVDGVPLPRCPGPLTTKAAEAFSALVERDLDP